MLVELKHIDLPQEMQRAMAKQAEAERERAGAGSFAVDVQAVTPSGETKTPIARKVRTTGKSFSRLNMLALLPLSRFLTGSQSVRQSGQETGVGRAWEPLPSRL